MPSTPPDDWLGRWAVRSDGSQRLAVLGYHRIGDRTQGPPGMISATPRAFERQMRWLAASGRALSLDSVLAARAEGSPFPPGAVTVTFDDAYADFAEHAWPVLRGHGIPVTLFVPTALPGDPHAAFWWDRLYAALAGAGAPLATPLGRLRLDTSAARRRAYRALRDQVKLLPHDEAMALVDDLVAALGSPPPQARVLSWDELRALAREGVTLAPHTRTHPCLDRLPHERVSSEIEDSLAELTAETGAAAPAFAYPAGQVSATAEETVRNAGFELAFTTSSGVATLSVDDPLRLPRLCVGRRDSPGLLRARLVLARARRPTPSATAGERPAVAYVMSRFPKISETFILTEIVSLERRGVRVEVYPLLRERPACVHPEAAEIAGRAHYLPFLSPAVLASQLYWLGRCPRAYLGALRDVATGTFGSLNFLAGGLAVFPKVAHAARLMQSSGVVHVHCHFASHPALAGLVIHRLTGLPFSFTGHGSDLHVERRMLPEKVAEAAFVATVSRYNRRIILDECGGRFAHKVHVIHAGVDTALFAPHRNGNGRPGPLHVLCVGTLHEVKGQAHLIEACRVLAGRGFEIACRLVGDGPDRRMLTRRIAEAGLNGHVVLVGECTRSEVAAELARADVLVAPSVRTRAGKREGIPVALMEAMSSGLPVVASDLSGIPELVEHGVTGLLALPGDEASLANALGALYEDRTLGPRLGESARERVLADFDAERSVGELVWRFGLEHAA
jgi:glycosyltransferase involved in cell wall biosynthesis/peptidoglycan/xylan/chitin deacetylase (PgdA/CDA1 family)